MQPKTLERWQFSASVLLPVILALVITAAAVLGFVFWSTANIDQRAVERQSSMVSQVIEARRLRVQHDLESVAIWDDAVVNTRLMFNFNWVDVNLGTWMHDFFGHNRSVILDANGTPIYAMENGVSVVPENYGRLASSVLPIVERVRAIHPASATAGELAPPAAVADFVLVEGRPAIVSAMTIYPTAGR